MHEHVTLLGRVATIPRFLRTAEGLAVCSFRFSGGWSRRPGQREQGPDRNWYTVTALRQLAEHARTSLSAGDRLIITGSLRLIGSPGGERGGVIAEIEAVSIGHDLRWNSTRVLRRGAGSPPVPLRAAGETEPPEPRAGQRQASGEAAPERAVSRA